jgi:CheY-like chemotaxis protein
MPAAGVFSPRGRPGECRRPGTRLRRRPSRRVGAGGTDLTRQLSGDGDGDGTRILAITAHTGAGTRDLALSAGADQFMTKPFAMNELLEQARALTSDRTS